MRCKRCKCKVCSCIKNDVPKIAVNGIVQNQNENDVVNIKVPTKTSQLINDSGFGQGNGGGTGGQKIEDIRVNGELVPIINKEAIMNVPTKTSNLINDSNFVTKPYVDTHIVNKANPHNVTKEQVGLGNVDNTSDINKPISAATQLALDSKILTTDVKSEIIYEDLKPINSKAVEKYAVKRINTIADLRNTLGEYEGQIVSLLGYYEAGDKEPLNYKWTSTQGVDDGGSVIKSGSGSWIAQFSKYVNSLDFGIRGNYDEITKIGDDNTPKFVNLFKVSSVSVFKISVGNYLLNNPVKLPNGISVIGESSNSVKLYRGTSIGTSTGIFYQISANKDEVVEGNYYENISFYGQSTSSNHNNWTHLLTGAGVKNMTVNNCKFIGFRGDGIEISAGASAIDERRNFNILITNCYFNGVTKNNRNGVSVTACNDITIENCYFENIGSPVLNQSVGAIDIERNYKEHQQTNNVRILNNIFKNIDTTNTAGVALFAYGLDVSSEGMFSGKNHEVRGNRFLNCYWGINIPEDKVDETLNQTPTSINIHSNWFVQNACALQMAEVSNVDIRFNHFYGNYSEGKYCNVQFRTITTPRDVSICSNYFYNTGRNGTIEIGSVNGLYIKDNIINSNRPFINQELDSSSNVGKRELSGIVVEDNVFTNNSSSSLFLYQLAFGDNNLKNILVNHTCSFKNNTLRGNSRLSNITKSLFPNFEKDSHITKNDVLGSWRAGDKINCVVDGYIYDVVCTKSGTSDFDTNKVVTATNGSNLINLENALNENIRKGMFVNIGDSSLVYEIIDVFDSTVILKSNYNGTSGSNLTMKASNADFITTIDYNNIKSVSVNTNTGIAKGLETLIFTGGGTAQSIITTDTNGFKGAKKVFKNLKSGVLNVKVNTGLQLNGVDGGSFEVPPMGSIEVVLIDTDKWVTIPTYVKSNAVASISTSDATDLASALTLINELKAKLNSKLQADRNSGQQAT